jgi:hypothetical protein
VLLLIPSLDDFTCLTSYETISSVFGPSAIYMWLTKQTIFISDPSSSFLVHEPIVRVRLTTFNV